LKLALPVALKSKAEKRPMEGPVIAAVDVEACPRHRQVERLGGFGQPTAWLRGGPLARLSGLIALDEAQHPKKLE